MTRVQTFHHRTKPPKCSRATPADSATVCCPTEALIPICLQASPGKNPPHNLRIPRPIGSRFVTYPISQVGTLWAGGCGDCFVLAPPVAFIVGKTVKTALHSPRKLSPGPIVLRSRGCASRKDAESNRRRSA